MSLCVDSPLMYISFRVHKCGNKRLLIRLKFYKVHMYVAEHDYNHQYISMPDGITQGSPSVQKVVTTTKAYRPVLSPLTPTE